MKLNTAKEVWIARLIAWVVIGAISCGIIFATTFMLGANPVCRAGFEQQARRGDLLSGRGKHIHAGRRIRTDNK